MDAIDQQLHAQFEKEVTAFETEHNLPAITKHTNNAHLRFARKGRFMFLNVVFEGLIDLYRNSTHANYWCEIDRQFIAGTFNNDNAEMPIPQDAGSLGALAVTWENYKRFENVILTENGPQFDFEGHLLNILGIKTDDSGWNHQNYECCRDYWTEAMSEIEEIEDAGARIKARYEFLTQTKIDAKQ